MAELSFPNLSEIRNFQPPPQTRVGPPSGNKYAMIFGKGTSPEDAESVRKAIFRADVDVTVIMADEDAALDFMDERAGLAHLGVPILPEARANGFAVIKSVNVRKNDVVIHSYRPDEISRVRDLGIFV